MDFDLSPDHDLIRSTVRDFAEQEIAPVAEELDREKRFPYEIVAKLGELGLMGIPFPEEYGGGGGDSLAYAIAVEELARVRTLPASEPASGSVSPKAPSFSPAVRTGSQSRFCSSEPNRYTGWVPSEV